MCLHQRSRERIARLRDFVRRAAVRLSQRQRAFVVRDRVRLLARRELAVGQTEQVVRRLSSSPQESHRFGKNKALHGSEVIG